jgi:hypothetical protein
MKTIYLVASGDLRLSANEDCEPAQAAMERQIVAAVESIGGKIQRAHPYIEEKKHGFIDSQKYGLEVFRSIPPDAPLIVAEAVWQYTNHVLPGLITHRGPILTLANWSGTWPGLVGMLNLNVLRERPQALDEKRIGQARHVACRSLQKGKDSRSRGNHRQEIREGIPQTESHHGHLR